MADAESSESIKDLRYQLANTHPILAELDRNQPGILFRHIAGPQHIR